MSNVSHKRMHSANGTGVNWLLVILLILLLGFLWRSQGMSRRLADLTGWTSEKPIIARGDLAEDEKATIALFKRASPSVVHIVSLKVDLETLAPDSIDAPGSLQATGSGIVWDESGYIVTNYHLIDKAGAAKVILTDQSDWDARVVGTAPDKDIAVLKIEAPAARLHPIEIGDSTNLQVGQKVFAIGNPFGLDQTLTTGVIGGLGREIVSKTGRPIQGVILTNAATNPGNSGGPLLDSAGLAIGINTAIISPSGASAGIGFAVPIESIREIVPQLIKYGKIERVGMGVIFWNDAVPAWLGLKGVLVNFVTEGSPAASAGIRATEYDENLRPTRPGDLIVAINDRPIGNSRDVYRILDQYKAGETLRVRLRHNGEEREVQVTLGVLN
ncbi:MAG: trypsin-like serine protease [Planctomycetaceae bacterium]|nr:trypsin-like serine protease [Planctomycetaceae bacterium]